MNTHLLEEKDAPSHAQDVPMVQGVFRDATAVDEGTITAGVIDDHPSGLGRAPLNYRVGARQLGVVQGKRTLSMPFSARSDWFVGQHV